MSHRTSTWAMIGCLALFPVLFGCNGKKGGDEDADADADGDAVTDDGGTDGIDITGDDAVTPDLDVVEDGELPGPDALCFEHVLLEGPNGGNQQTASLVLDVDGDGVNDFVITERTQAPSVVWYRRTGEGWDLYTVDDTTLRIEAGGDWHDIDGDGDPDIVFGGDSSSNQVWWWENPAPDFDPDTPWTRGKGGYKLLQYMAMGIPAVASPVGITREIVRDGINGFLATSEEEWVEKLSLLIERPDLRRCFALEGRKTVEARYSVRANFPRFLEILKDAATKTPRHKEGNILYA